MPLSEDFVLVQDPPRMLEMHDVHNGEITNDTGTKQPKVGDPNALAINQADKFLVALGHTAYHTILEIDFTAGAPVIVAVWSMRDDVVPADFTPEDVGDGETEVTHTGGKLPAMRFKPGILAIHEDGIDSAFTETITNGFRVTTKAGGTGTDANLTVGITGI